MCTEFESGFPEFIETTNDYGLPQTMQYDGYGKYFAVCAQCKSCVMPNRGQGTICDKCAHDADIEMEHDYAEGNYPI